MQIRWLTFFFCKQILAVIHCKIMQKNGPIFFNRQFELMMSPLLMILLKALKIVCCYFVESNPVIRTVVGSGPLCNSIIILIFT